MSGLWLSDADHSGHVRSGGGTSIQQALGITDAQIDLGHGEFRGWLSITPTCSLLCFELTEPFLQCLGG